MTKPFPLCFAAILVATVPLATANAQTLQNAPLALVGRTGAVSVYSREINRVTDSARAMDATWLGTRLCVKRVDAQTGAVRGYSKSDGLPFGAVVSIATDDAGRGAVALVSDTDTTVAFCLYHPDTDRWQVLARLPSERLDWIAEIREDYWHSYFRWGQPTYRVAIGNRYAVIVPSISLPRTPLVTRYERRTGKAAEPITSPTIVDKTEPFIVTNGVVRFHESLYLATNRGLRRVDLNTGAVTRYLSDKNVLKVAVSPSVSTGVRILWGTATANNGKSYGGREDRYGEMFAFSPVSNEVVGEGVSLSDVGDIGTWYSNLRVGEDGFPYLVRKERFARYEPERKAWFYFDLNGKEGNAREIDDRYRSARWNQNRLPVAPASVVPDTIAAEQALSLIRPGWEFQNQDALQWLGQRFATWLSPDVRDERTPSDPVERRELNALPAFGYWGDLRTDDPFIARRQWSVRNYPSQVVKWNAPVAQTLGRTFGTAFVHETMPPSNTSGLIDDSAPAKKPEEPITKIPLLLPLMRRGSPSVIGLRDIWLASETGNRYRNTILETQNGILRLSQIGNDGDVITQWLSPEEKKALERKAAPPINPTAPLPPDAMNTFPRQEGTAPALRLLSDGMTTRRFVAVQGSPCLWIYDNSERTWRQSLTFPKDAQRYVTGTKADLEKLLVANDDGLLVGDANGLWKYEKDYERERWIPVRLPQRLVPMSNALLETVEGNDISLKTIAADKTNLFIGGKGTRQKDPPLLLRWNKQTTKTTFLTEGEYGIPSLRGGTPILMSDGEAVWCALQGGEKDGDVGGGYRWNERANRFDRITEEPVVQMETDSASNDFFLLTRTALLSWNQQSGKTKRYALPTPQAAQSLLQTPETVFVAAQNTVWAWNKRKGKWRKIADTPRLIRPLRMQLISCAKNEKALWVYDESTLVRVALPAPTK